MTAIKTVILLLSFIFLSFCFNNALESAAENGHAAETANELAGEMLKGRGRCHEG